MFGDFNQLQPVLDGALYAEPKVCNEIASKGRLVFKSFQCFIKITSNQRQKRGGKDFRRLLDHIADGSFNRADYNLLMTHKGDKLNNQDKEQFTKALHLYPTNDLVLERNNNYLRWTKNPVARIEALSHPEIAMASSEDLAFGLPTVINLSNGTPVMLRYNLSVCDGLVNGSLEFRSFLDFFESGARSTLISVFEHNNAACSENRIQFIAGFDCSPPHQSKGEPAIVYYNMRKRFNMARLLNHGLWRSL